MPGVLLQYDGEGVIIEVKKVTLTNGEEIAYRERPGGQQVVILIHGNMTSSKHWDVLIDTLDSRYKVYAIDLRGFGYSTYYHKITSINDFSDDLKLFVDELNLHSFVLVGWSTGGAVAMQFEVDYPGLCEKIVLVASASTRGYPMFGTLADGTVDSQNHLQTLEEIEQDPKTIGMQHLYDTKNKEGLRSVWNAVIYTHHQPETSQYEAYLDDMLTQRNLADVYYALNTFNLGPSHNGVSEGTKEAENIQVPVLVMYGERDAVVTKQMTEEIMEDLRYVAQYVELEDVGHSPMIDDLPQFKSEIERFINEE